MPDYQTDEEILDRVERMDILRRSLAIRLTLQMQKAEGKLMARILNGSNANKQTQQHKG